MVSWSFSRWDRALGSKITLPQTSEAPAHPGIGWSADPGSRKEDPDARSHASLRDARDRPGRDDGETGAGSRSDDAIVRATIALVCTSDTHTVHGAIGERKDLTLGHEAVGVVAKLGSNVRGFREGDRVAVNAITPCFRCTDCQRGYTSQCTQMLGGWKFANLKDGVFADYFHVNAAEANLASIPDELTTSKLAIAATCSPPVSSAPSTPTSPSGER